MIEKQQEIKHKIQVLKNCKLSTFIKVMFKKNVPWWQCKLIDNMKKWDLHHFWTGRKW